METVSPNQLGIDRMRIVGGNLAVDFANTRSGPHSGPPDDDLLTGFGDLVAWGRLLGTIDQPAVDRLMRAARRDPDAARGVFERALRLRDELDGVLRSIASGTRVPAESLSALRDLEAGVLGHAALVERDGRFAWSWEDDLSLMRPLGPIAHAAVVLLTDGPVERLKACPGCSFLFVDESKNQSRRWCSMDDCGTDEKMRRYVARRASRRQGQTASPGIRDSRLPD